MKATPYITGSVRSEEQKKGCAGKQRDSGTGEKPASKDGRSVGTVATVLVGLEAIRDVTGDAQIALIAGRKRGVHRDAAREGESVLC